MKKSRKKFLTIILCIVIITLSACKSENAVNTEDVSESERSEVNADEILATWSNGDSASRQKIIDYIEAVTDEQNASFIPEEDRIAAFDMDGTILCEAPDSMDLLIAQYRIEHDLQDDEEVNEILKEFQEACATTPKPDNYYELYGEVTTRAFEGMPEDDVVDYVSEFMKNHDSSTFEGLTYVDLFYQPMVELIAYLQANDFEVYVISGAVRSLVWGCVQAYNDCYPENPLDLNRAHMIGTDQELVPSGNTEAASDYLYQPDDQLLRGDEAGRLDTGMEKVIKLYRQSGKTPVFVVGNTSGDFSLLNMAKSSEYESMACLIWHDDMREIEYNTSDEWQELSEQYEWQIISMKEDFKEVFVK